LPTVQKSFDKYVFPSYCKILKNIVTIVVHYSDSMHPLGTDKLFISSLTPSHHVFLERPLCLHHCIMFDRISVVSTFQISKPPQFNHQTDWFQSQKFSAELHVFHSFFKVNPRIHHSMWN